MGGPGELSSPLLQLLPASPLCPWGRGLLLALLRAFQSPHCCHFPQERICRFRPVPTAPCSFVQGIISLLSHAAESNFQTVLATLTMFASRLCKGHNARISRRKKVKRYGFPSWHSSALFSQQLLPWEPRCITSVSRHFFPHRWSWTARELMPHAALSCSPTAAWHCVPPRNSCSPTWRETSWATS